MLRNYLFITIFYLFLFPIISAAQLCDESLRPVSQPALAYKQRASDRCEGFYDAQVSSFGTLQLVGLLRGNLSGGDIVLRAPDSVGETLRVRAVALPETIYYRMDGIIRSGHTLRWLTTILNAGRLRIDDVGVYGYLENDSERYVPLQTGQGAARTNLMLRASRDLIRLFWRYAPVRQGACGVMNDWQSLEPPGGFDGGKAIEIKLPVLAELCVEAAGLTIIGSEWLRGLWQIQGAH